MTINFYAAHLMGIAGLPFHGISAPFCIMISAVFALGLSCILLRRFSDAKLITDNIVFIGLLGTAVGLNILFRAIGQGAADPEAAKAMFWGMGEGMMVATYATILGIAARLWLKMNIRLLAEEA